MELKDLKKETDGWVKDFNKKFTEIENKIEAIPELTQNTDHNYEMYLELQAEMQKLKEELAAIRMIQTLHLRIDVKNSPDLYSSNSPLAEKKKLHP